MSAMNALTTILAEAQKAAETLHSESEQTIQDLTGEKDAQAKLLVEKDEENSDLKKQLAQRQERAAESEQTIRDLAREKDAKAKLLREKDEENANLKREIAYFRSRDAQSEHWVQTLSENVGRFLRSRLLDEIDVKQFGNSLLNFIQKIVYEVMDSKLVYRGLEDGQELDPKLAQMLSPILCGNSYYDYRDSRPIKSRLLYGLLSWLFLESGCNKLTEKETWLREYIEEEGESFSQDCSASEFELRHLKNFLHGLRVKCQANPKFEENFPSEAKETTLEFFQIISPLYEARNNAGEAIEIVSAEGTVHPDWEDWVKKVEEKLLFCKRYCHQMRFSGKWPQTLWPDQDTPWDEKIMRLSPSGKDPLKVRKIMTYFPALVTEMPADSHKPSWVRGIFQSQTYVSDDVPTVKKVTPSESTPAKVADETVVPASQPAQPATSMESAGPSNERSRLVTSEVAPLISSPPNMPAGGAETSSLDKEKAASPEDEEEPSNKQKHSFAPSEETAAPNMDGEPSRENSHLPAPAAHPPASSTPAARLYASQPEKRKGSPEDGGGERSAKRQRIFGHNSSIPKWKGPSGHPESPTPGKRKTTSVDNDGEPSRKKRRHNNPVPPMSEGDSEPATGPASIPLPRTPTRPPAPARTSSPDGYLPLNPDLGGAVAASNALQSALASSPEPEVGEDDALPETEFQTPSPFSSPSEAEDENPPLKMESPSPAPQPDNQNPGHTGEDTQGSGLRKPRFLIYKQNGSRISRAQATIEQGQRSLDKYYEKHHFYPNAFPDGRFTDNPIPLKQE